LPVARRVESIVFKWFRTATSPHQTGLAMIGARAGDRVIFVGGSHPGLVAELALTTGLNGEVRVAAPAGRQAEIEAAAARAGALVEFATYEAGPLPALDDPFDIAVWAGDLAAVTAEDRQARTRELMALLRPGGRIILVDGTPAGRFASGRQATLPREAGVALLTGSDAVAARVLATADRLTYYEARKPR
jgi:SAM-dependent methyltransferase